MPRAAIWRSRPVFVTSTFRDMHAERDYLHNHVFPELAERLKQRFHHLEPIDLRWGVETVSAADEQAKELLVLKVCFSEIERSRPFLIALIGDRYGWVPPAERMEAAAREAGFQGETAGKSITALEIEYGVLDTAGQSRRSRFYFRDPMPYGEMLDDVADVYSDAYSRLPGAAEAHHRLEGLKQRIKYEMPDRVRTYSTQWDPARRRIVGLEEWGQQVLEDLWRDLEEETKEFAGLPPSSWQQEEAVALEQFVENQCRDFIGRAEMIGALLEHGASLASPDAMWGVCVEGSSGSGKSSLFAELYRQFQEEDSLLLAHAAGITTRSTQVDTILRRWTADLAEHLGVPDPCLELTEEPAVERAFAELLSRTAVNRRVVCLIDALNQFEPTPRARHLTWLPEPWPLNARLIATAVPGDHTESLGRRHGVRSVLLPLLDMTEAAQIAITLCRRYHKEINPTVLQILTSKRLSNGELAVGIPLWLHLALEELLLLDAEDFERAEREFAGSPGQKLRALLADVAEKLPPDTESLYQYLLARTEVVYGESLARGFANLIAVSRSGWRESDLRFLIPAITGEEWGALRFAALRRGFRAHLVQRGALSQWDFFHALAREAVERRNLGDPALVRHLHSTIADYLETLPADDALYRSEYMVHLIGCDDRDRASFVYSDRSRQDKGHGDTRALSDYVIRTQERVPPLGLNWVLSLMDQNLEVERLAMLVHRLCGEFQEALRNSAPVRVRLRLCDAIRIKSEELRRQYPDNAEIARALAACYGKLVDLYLNLGETALALESEQMAISISEDLHKRFPDDTTDAANLAMDHNVIANLYKQLGESAQALQNFQRAVSVVEDLRRREPGLIHFGVLLITFYSNLANLYSSMEDSEQALSSYRRAISVGEELRQNTPGNSNYALAQVVSGAYNNLGVLQVTLKEPTQAVDSFENARSIRESLHRQMPDNTAYAWMLSDAYHNLGNLRSDLGETERAFEDYGRGLSILEKLCWKTPDNVEFLHSLWKLHKAMGRLNQRLEKQTPGLKNYQSAQNILEELHRRLPNRHDFTRELSVTCTEVGSVYVSLSEPLLALEQCREALRISAELQRQVPEDVYTSDLAACYNNLGDLYLIVEEREPAREHYERALALREELHRRAPGSEEHSRELANSYQRLRKWHERASNFKAAQLYSERCIEILRAMKAAGMYLDQAYARLLDEVEKENGRNRSVSGGLASVAHTKADPDKAMRLNLEYQKAKTEWQSLPWWKRLLARRPERPDGI